ncbi:MAG: LuxR C-terminal-related transcriptional regulator [Beijerinckiaceae bacterium]|jgi:DNA-binding CsgD family transcriptional regulator|nr:LuxR C-terminal-related transcriptional regulator [Beijerinckiaceae bacterium]
MNFIADDAEGLRMTVAALSRVRTSDQLAALTHRISTFEPVKFVGFSYWRGLDSDRPVDWWASTFPKSFHAIFGSTASLRRHQVANRSVCALLPVDWLEVSQELGDDHPDVQACLAMGLSRTGLSCAARGRGRSFGILYVNFDVEEADWPTRRLSLAACVQLVSIYMHQKLVEVRLDLGAPEILSSRETACIKLAAEGKRVKQIAHLLAVSEQTVNFYLGRARIKLGVSNTTQAAVMATELGLLDTEQRDY